ncbi:MAG: HAMP domain-containing protein [Spirochaetes bacterium]|nr:HAMP domain-containing protein [Spirochaetota bacterium]MBU0956839.1 HAMP domain-containing protein [Spirochaetota bacterium]
MSRLSGKKLALAKVPAVPAASKGREAGSAAPEPAVNRPRWPYRIAVRIFAFNLLLLLVPVLALGFFRNYEQSLLDAQEHAMTQQGRFLAAWLSAGESAVDRAAARQALAALEQRHTARFRIVAADNSLLADSSVAGRTQAALVPAEESTIKLLSLRNADYTEPASVTAGSEPATAAESTWIYRLMSLPVRLWRRYIARPAVPLESVDYYEGRRMLDGPEVQAALAGRYGAITRVAPAGQNSVTLYTALPVLHEGQVVAAVLVSQSTYRILDNLYNLRLDAGRTFLAGLALAVLGTLLLSFTITRPLGRLAALARKAVRPDGTVQTVLLPDSRRPDEIGDLQRSLSYFATALQDQAGRAEAFASDVAHELKNPITSARASLEVLETVRDQEQGRHFIASARLELDRMLELLASLRLLATAEAGRSAASVPGAGVDAAASQGAVGPTSTDKRDTGERSCDPAFVIRQVLQALADNPAFVGKLPEIRFDNFLPALPGYGRAGLQAGISSSSLRIIVRNLVENAVGFTPATTPLLLVLRLRLSTPADQTAPGNPGSDIIELLVADSGPGVPPEHREKIFTRFFTWRPDQDRRSHSGLGLSIARGLARAVDGDVGLLDTAANVPVAAGLAAELPGGACFFVHLPISV